MPEDQSEPGSEAPDRLEKASESEQKLPVNREHNRGYWDRVGETLQRKEREKIWGKMSELKKQRKEISGELSEADLRKLDSEIKDLEDKYAELAVGDTPTEIPSVTGAKTETVEEAMADAMALHKEKVVEEARKDLAAVTEEEIEAAVDVAEAGEPLKVVAEKEDYVGQERLKQLKEETANLYKGERGVQALEDALKVKYNYDAARQSVAGFGGKLKVGFRKMFDGGFRKMLNEYKAKLADYNTKMEEQELLNLQLNNPGEYEEYMADRATRAQLKGIGKKKKKAPR